MTPRGRGSVIWEPSTLEKYRRGSSPRDGPKDARLLLFVSDAEPIRPGRSEEGCLKLLRAEVQV